MKQEFQKIYLQKLGPSIEALLAAGKGLSRNFEESAISIRRLVHSLRGSGGTYGFPEISELSAATEDAPDDELAETLDRLIEHLQGLYGENRPEREHILVVDDSDEIRLMLKVILEKQGYAVTTVETAQKGIDVLAEEDFQLMILDLVLPDIDGRNFLIKLRGDHRTASLPVLVLSAKDSPQIKAECFALGADDYFEKPLDPALLTTRVAVTLQRSRNLEKETRYDHLTNLPNRAAFTENFEALSKLSLREKTHLCLAMLDIDDFKSINDGYGHLVGDEALRYVANQLREQLRKSDFVARWGGEEFALLLPSTTELEGKTALSKALIHLNQHPMSTNSGKTIKLTYSGGVYQIKEGEDLNQALSQADALLFNAKAAGRNCIVASNDDVGTRSLKILLAEDDELTAEFVLHRLRKDGFEIDHFDRGDAALEAARKSKYDLAIFDVKMPGMEGFELLQRTRADSMNQKTPVIMLTSMGSEQDISRGLQLGANDYVLKPFSPMELLARIRRLLK
ncbi:MAG: response regulator [Candidatus Marinimicrobia bacterium]|nr:response regulator [Candidatus Neomarinimicrobiota bacterium]